MEAHALIDINALSFTYPGAPGPALSGLSFRICRGERAALLGANGSGKSTLLSCLNGLLKPPPGTVSVYGMDPSDEAQLEKIRRRLGTVLQNPDDQIISSVVEEDIAFGPENLGLSKAEIRARLDEVLDRCDLRELRERPTQFLSGGERQRLALAGVLALDTDSIILDEAVSMLDPAGKEHFFKLLDKLSSEGKTIIQVTHSLEEALLCGRCIVLSKGSLVFDGSPEDLLERNEFEAWGFALPESIRTLRIFSAEWKGFHVNSLDPREAAEKIHDLQKTRPAGSPGERFKPAGAGGGTRYEGADDPARHDDPARRGVPAIRFDSAFHHYHQGTDFSVPAINDVSFVLRSASPSGRGIILALIGKSGSGKSTVLKHINALLLPGAGRVTVLGMDTLDRGVKLSALRMRVSLSIQNPESALFETFTADDVAFGPANGGLRGAALRERVRAAMEEAGLPFGEFADRKTRSLSGGEKRRAAIAGAAAMEGDILLLDEPLAGLDGVQRERILSMIRGLRDRGKTVVISTHSMEAAAACDMVGVMVNGNLAACGPPGDIFGRHWDPSWGLSLPWIAAAAGSLAERGSIPPVNQAPLNAEELVSLILNGKGERGERNEEGGIEPGVGELPHRGRKRKKTGIEFFRNVSFGRFLDRPSVLRKLSAGWKLGLLFFLAAAAIAGPPPFFPLGVLVFTLLSGRFLGRTGPAHLLRGLVPIAPWIVVIMVLQLFFTSPSDTGRVLFSRYFIQITVDELFRILAILFRVSSLMAMLSLYSAVTPLRETMGAINSFLSVFGRFGFPSRDVSLAAGIALRFVPVLTEEAERIVTAQLSRGGKKKRLGMILSMMAPLFLRALERSEALARAMMLRLYRRGPLYP